MLNLAVFLLAATELLGIALVALYPRLRPERRRTGVPGYLHAALGSAGLLALLAALRGPPRGVAMGAGGFGAMASGLFGLALLAGVGLLSQRLRRRPAQPLLIGVHATLAISGLVLLAAWWSLPP